MAPIGGNEFRLTGRLRSREVSASLVRMKTGGVCEKHLSNTTPNSRSTSSESSCKRSTPLAASEVMRRWGAVAAPAGIAASRFAPAENRARLVPGDHPNDHR
ncbi:MAG TPA: hypothetical protein VIT91_10870 [Chthoniobacterales bacterium]